QKLAGFFFQFKGMPQEVYDNYKSMIWATRVYESKTMMKLLEKEAGCKISDLFSEFNEVPIGIGSVSQVYKARLKSGELVAVKIQYPDLFKAVQQDLAVLNRVVRLVKDFIPAIDHEKFIEKMHEIFYRESNFMSEAAVYDEIRSHLSENNHFIVPKIFHNLCSEKVLVMELMNGLKFYDFVENADYLKRQQAFQHILEYDSILTFEYGMLQMDYHPGNFLFTDSRLVCLDPGMYLKVSEAERMVFKKIQKSIYGQDPHELFKTFVDIGYIDGSRQSYTQEMAEFMNKTISFVVMRDDCCDPLSDFVRIFFKTGANIFFAPEMMSIYLAFYNMAVLNGTLAKLNIDTERAFAGFKDRIA
ncbi:MAG: AarF/ABC1/UbiB kinase family protein, partial [Oligoflexales bacterium]|nr:AarF/ABC1/UbiB kinase family protein [Oligoflexales bacterium]